MRARSVRKQWRVLVASLIPAMVLPFVGSGVAYGLPTETGRLSSANLLTETAPRGDSAMTGGYSTHRLRTGATTTATFLVPEFDATDCGPTGEAWVSRYLNRGSLVVQIWTHCTSGRVSAGGWLRDGSFTKDTPELSPGERVTVSTKGSRSETRLSVHNLDRGWVAEITSASAPKGGITVVAENVWDGDLPFIEHASFKRLRIDHRALGEYAPKRIEYDCTRVSPLRQGTSFRVTHTCAP